jgi:hypothetical protein
MRDVYRISRAASVPGIDLFPFLECLCNDMVGRCLPALYLISAIDENVGRVGDSSKGTLQSADFSQTTAFRKCLGEALGRATPDLAVETVGSRTDRRLTFCCPRGRVTKMSTSG